MKRPLRKVADYLVLTLIVSASIVITLLLSGNRPYQIFTVILVSILYVIWGIVHHKREGSFYPKIALEYFLFALLGSILVTGLL